MVDVTTVLNHVNPIYCYVSIFFLFLFFFKKTLKFLNLPHKNHHFKKSMNFYNRLFLTNGRGPYSPLYVCDQFLTMFHSLCGPLYIGSISICVVHMTISSIIYVWPLSHYDSFFVWSIVYGVYFQFVWPIVYRGTRRVYFLGTKWRFDLALGETWFLCLLKYPMSWMR